MFIVGNLQISMCGNQSVSCVAPDNNMYPCYPYMPGNFSITGEHNPNQIDRMYLMIYIVTLYHVQNYTCKCVCICMYVNMYVYIYMYIRMCIAYVYAFTLQYLFTNNVFFFTFFFRFIYIKFVL